jgi:hypothetical protein
MPDHGSNLNLAAFSVHSSPIDHIVMARLEDKWHTIEPIIELKRY